MLAFLYPRMDYNVSTSQNHLLKLPFSIHPSSHKVSVPIFPNSVRDFDPDCKSIKFKTLIEELSEVGKKCNYFDIQMEIKILIDKTLCYNHP